MWPSSLHSSVGDAPSTVVKTASVCIRGATYNVQVTATQADIAVHLENDVTLDHWFNTFTTEYVDEMTRKTGSQRRFSVFVSMLGSALDRCAAGSAALAGSTVQTLSSGVSLDILFIEDIERMKNEKAMAHAGLDATLQTARARSRCFLILAYAAEFERTFYPLPLNKVPPPHGLLEEWLFAAYRASKLEAARLRDALASRPHAQDAPGGGPGSAGLIPAEKAQRLVDEIRTLKSVVENLETEKRQALKAAELAIEQRDRLKEKYEVLYTTVKTANQSLSGSGRSMGTDTGTREASGSGYGQRRSKTQPNAASTLAKVTPARQRSRSASRVSRSPSPAPPPASNIARRGTSSRGGTPRDSPRQDPSRPGHGSFARNTRTSRSVSPALSQRSMDSRGDAESFISQLQERRRAAGRAVGRTAGHAPQTVQDRRARVLSTDRAGARAPAHQRNNRQYDAEDYDSSVDRPRSSERRQRRVDDGAGSDYDESIYDTRGRQLAAVDERLKQLMKILNKSRRSK